MPTSFTFEYTLPFHDHAWQSRTTKFMIEASVDDFGFITFVPPHCQQIINQERVHRDITLAARREFDRLETEKRKRIAEGEQVLKNLLEEKTVERNTTAILIILTLLLILTT